MQWMRIMITAGLAGVWVGGTVFLGWDLLAKLRELLSTSRRRHKMQSEEAALSKEEPATEKREG